jgi:hypothetical protein
LFDYAPWNTKVDDLRSCITSDKTLKTTFVCKCSKLKPGEEIDINGNPVNKPTTEGDDDDDDGDSSGGKWPKLPGLPKLPGGGLPGLPKLPGVGLPDLPSGGLPKLPGVGLPSVGGSLPSVGGSLPSVSGGSSLLD